MITNKRAREIAANWYGGQWTGLYMIASCERLSALTVENWNTARAEAVTEERKAWAAHRDRDVLALRSLISWIDRAVSPRAIMARYRAELMADFDGSSDFFRACWSEYHRMISSGAIDGPKSIVDADGWIESIAAKKVNNPRSRYYIFG